MALPASAASNVKIVLAGLALAAGGACHGEFRCGLDKYRNHALARSGREGELIARGGFERKGGVVEIVVEGLGGADLGQRIGDRGIDLGGGRFGGHDRQPLFPVVIGLVDALLVGGSEGDDGGVAAGLVELVFGIEVVDRGPLLVELKCRADQLQCELPGGGDGHSDGREVEIGACAGFDHAVGRAAEPDTPESVAGLGIHSLVGARPEDQCGGACQSR